MVKKSRRHSRPLFPTIERWREGMVLNIHYLVGRGLIWRNDQRLKALMKKKHPDIKRAIRNYPFREPLPSELSVLYRRTKRLAAKALGKWHNPWILTPSCCFVFQGEALALYAPYQHEIQVSEEFKYWYTQINCFAPRMYAAMRSISQGEQRKVKWVALGQWMLAEAADHREHLEEFENDGYFAGLAEAWLQFQQELPPLMGACEQDGLPSKAVVAWYQSLLHLRRELFHAFRTTIVHELIHGWTRWITVRDGTRKGRQLGLTEYQRDELETSARVKPTSAHVALHEALTEWIAASVCNQLYRRPLQFNWHGVICASRYPTWIIDYLVLALNHHWSRIIQEIPELAQQGIASAVELLYAMYLSNVQFIPYFKKVLAAMHGDAEAFITLSAACERFNLRPPCEEALLEEALENLRQLCAPFLDRAVLVLSPEDQERVLNGEIIVDQEH